MGMRICDRPLHSRSSSSFLNRAVQKPFAGEGSAQLLGGFLGVKQHVIPERYVNSGNMLPSQLGSSECFLLERTPRLSENLRLLHLVLGKALAFD